MKTKKELNALKEEVETVSRKPQALSDDELERVNGGTVIFPLNGVATTCVCSLCGKTVSGTIPFECEYCGYLIGCEKIR